MKRDLVLTFKIYIYIFYPEILLPELSHVLTRAQKYVIRVNTDVSVRRTAGNSVNVINRGTTEFHFLYPDCGIVM